MITGQYGCPPATTSRSTSAVCRCSSTTETSESGASEPVTSVTSSEVLLLMRRGGTNKDIAAARFVTPGTLRSQIKTLYRKLDVSTREEALARAAELDLL